MLLTSAVLKDFLSTIGLMAMLVIAYGTVTRAFARPAAAQAVLGALFGGAAVLAMFDPLHVAPGVIVDLRSVPVILAGAFLGLPGVAVAALMALAVRIGIGGAGVLAGSASIVVSGLIGLAWAGLVRRLPRRGAGHVALLAALSLLRLLTFFLLPWDLAWHGVTTIWPFVAPLQFAGVLMVGLLLERDRLIADGAKRRGAPPARTAIPSRAC